MSTHWITTWPLAGIVYALAAVGCAVWAIWRKMNRLLWPLTGLIFSIAVLNGYSEEWALFTSVHFQYISLVLTVLFVLMYRSFSLRLIERTGLRRPTFVKEQYSGLLQAYALFVGCTVVSLTLGKGENPPLELFAFIIFVCALHVPMFAFGRSKIANFLVKSALAASKAMPDISWGFFAAVMAILGTPLLLTLIVQAVVHDDYRLFTVDAVMTAIIFSLLVISRRGQFKEPVPERQANHGKGGSSLSQPL